MEVTNDHGYDGDLCCGNCSYVLGSRVPRWYGRLGRHGRLLRGQYDDKIVLEVFSKDLPVRVTAQTVVQKFVGVICPMG